MEIKIFVGQVLFREIKKRNAPTEIKEFVVSKVGNKYFYFDERELKDYPFNITTLQYVDKNYNQNDIQLYLSKQAILDKNEKYNLIEVLRKHFDWSVSSNKSTLEQLRNAAAALGLELK